MRNLKLRINKRRKNRYDIFDESFYKKVQNGFIKISQKKRNYMIINSNKTIEENKKIIINRINKLL